MSKQTHLVNLQVLRFVAAFMVLLSHLIHETEGYRIVGMQPAVDPTGINWSSGVDIFFVVSGFVMYYITRDRFGSVVYALDFIKRRIIRVVPLYWIFTALMVVSTYVFHSQVQHRDISASRLIESLLFFPSRRFDGQIQPVLALGWTLDFEMLFYFCFALALMVRQPMAMRALSIFFIIAAASGRLLPDYITALHFWCSPILLEFLMGIFIASVYIDGIRIDRFAQATIGVLSVILMVAGSHVMNWDRWIWAGLPAMILSASLILGPTIKSQALALGGDASYSLYLSHPFTLNIIAMLWSRLHLPLIAGLYVLAGIIICTSVAICVYLCIERPLMLLLRRRLESRRASLPA